MDEHPHLVSKTKMVEPIFMPFSLVSFLSCLDIHHSQILFLNTEKSKKKKKKMFKSW